MKIGLLSDTHGFLDHTVFEHFKDCDELWHAGDLGSSELKNKLERFKPLRCVYGNIDDLVMQKQLPEDLWFQCEGLSVWMTHIAGSPPNYNPRIKKILQHKKPDILVCGHSHILRVVRDNKIGFMYLNPGACGNQGFHHIKTLLRFDITGKEIKNMEVIELGKRGAILSSSD